MPNGKIDLDYPVHLTPREVAAFRLGVLKTMLACADEFGHEIPGIYRCAYENELEYREHQLEPEEA